MMISKEQIAHDLTMVYLCNRYGIDVRGSFCVSGMSGSSVTGDGEVVTDHFPSVDEPKYVKVKTDEKGIFGIEKTEKVQNGYVVDDIFKAMVEEYHQAYSYFCKLLEKQP